MSDQGRFGIQSDLLTAFWEGLTRPSLMAVGVAVVVTAVSLGAALELFTEESFGFWHGYMVPKEQDDYTFATGRVLKIAHAPPVKRAVVVLGSSTTRESVSGGNDLAKALGGDPQVRPTIYHLPTSKQSIWEMGAVLERLRGKFQGVVVLGISPTRLWQDREELEEIVRSPRFGFVSELIDEEARKRGLEVPHRSGIFLWDNRGFVSVRLRGVPRRILTGPKEWNPHRFLGRGQVSQAVWDEQVAGVQKNLESYPTESARNLEFLRRCCAPLPAAGIEVVLLEAPVNPRLVKEAWGEEFYSEYVTRLTQFARENGFEYLTLNELLDPGDYSDWAHIRRREAQLRYTRALGQRLQKYFPHEERGQ